MTEVKGFPDEAGTSCGGKTNVGLAKGLLGENLGLGKGGGGRWLEGCSGVEGREEMGVVRVHESVHDVGPVLVVLCLKTVEGLGG